MSNNGKPEEKKDGGLDNGNPAEDVKKPSDEEKEEKEEKKGLTGKHVALILGLFLILAAAAVIIVFLLRPAPQIELAATGVPTGNYIVTEANVTSIRDTLQAEIDRGMFSTFMNTTWTFPNGNSPSIDAVMGNSERNKFPFWFTLTLYGTDEVIYTSGLLPVGTRLAEIILDVPLPQGIYSAVVDINMIDDDGIQVETDLGLGITLVIQN